MTETFYKTGIHKIDYTTFGGIIHPSDFNTDYRGKDTPNGSSVANRIISDWNFDKNCKANKEECNRKINWRKKKND